MTFHVCAADLGFRSDASAAVVISAEQRTLSLAGWLERRPSNGRALQPSAVLADIARLARHFGCGEVWSDFHYSETAREELAKSGVNLRLGPTGATGKTVVWTAARAVILEGRVRVPRIHPLLTQLKAVRGRATSGGGLSIEQPRKYGSHGDLATAFALALWAATDEACEAWRWNALGDQDAMERLCRAIAGR